jgi:hypothetical protein
MSSMGEIRGKLRVNLECGPAQPSLFLLLSFINITMCCHLWHTERRWSYLSETYATGLLVIGPCCDFTCGQPFRELTHFPGPRTLQLSMWCPRVFHSLTMYAHIMLDRGTNTYLGLGHHNVFLTYCIYLGESGGIFGTKMLAWVLVR